MAEDTEELENYRSSLQDLTFNSKPLINMLTMLAEDHEQLATEIVQVIEQHIDQVKTSHKLPVMYLIDSIVKNLPSTLYPKLLSQNIVQVFCGVFEEVDEKTRQSLFKLRQTWKDIFPNKKLYGIDVRVNMMDPAWPITALPPEQGNIHVNPKFLVQSAEEKARFSPPAPSPPPDDAEELMRQQLLAKEQELQKLKLELELAETKAKLEQQKKQLEENHRVEQGHQKPESQPSVPQSKARDPRLASRDLKKSNRDPRLSQSQPLPTTSGNLAVLQNTNVVAALSNVLLGNQSAGESAGSDSDSIKLPVQKPEVTKEKQDRSKDEKKELSSSKRSPPDKKGKSESDSRKLDRKDRSVVDKKESVSSKSPKKDNSRNSKEKLKDSPKDLKKKPSKSDLRDTKSHDTKDSRQSRSISPRDRKDRKGSKEKDTKLKGRDKNDRQSSDEEYAKFKRQSRRDEESTDDNFWRSNRGNRSFRARNGDRNEGSRGRRGSKEEYERSARRSRSPQRREKERNQNNQKPVKKYENKKNPLDHQMRTLPDLPLPSMPLDQILPKDFDAQPPKKLNTLNIKREASEMDIDERSMDFDGMRHVGPPESKRPRVDAAGEGNSGNLFGGEDIDYRFAGGTPLKSPMHDGWMKFKTSRPDEYADELERRKSRDDMLLEDTDFRRIQSPPFKMRPSPFPPLQLASNIAIPQELQLDRQQEILLQAEKQVKAGTLSHEQHQDFLKQLGRVFEIQRTRQKQATRVDPRVAAREAREKEAQGEDIVPMKQEDTDHRKLVEAEKHLMDINRHVGGLTDFDSRRRQPQSDVDIRKKLLADLDIRRKALADSDSRKSVTDIDIRQQTPVDIDIRQKLPSRDPRKRLAVESEKKESEVEKLPVDIDARKQPQGDIDIRRKPPSDVDSRKAQLADVDTRQMPAQPVDIDSRKKPVDVDNRNKPSDVDIRQRHADVDVRKQQSVGINSKVHSDVISRQQSTGDVDVRQQSASDVDSRKVPPADTDIRRMSQVDPRQKSLSAPSKDTEVKTPKDNNAGLQASSDVDKRSEINSDTRQKSLKDTNIIEKTSKDVDICQSPPRDVDIRQKPVSDVDDRQKPTTDIDTIKKSPSNAAQNNNNKVLANDQQTAIIKGEGKNEDTAKKVDNNLKLNESNRPVESTGDVDDRQKHVDGVVSPEVNTDVDTRHPSEETDSRLAPVDLDMRQPHIQDSPTKKANRPGDFEDRSVNRLDDPRPDVRPMGVDSRPKKQSPHLACEDSDLRHGLPHENFGDHDLRQRPPQDFNQRPVPQDVDQRGHSRQFDPRGPPRDFGPRGPPQDFDIRGPKRDFDPRGPPLDFDPRDRPTDFDPRDRPQDFHTRGPHRDFDPRGPPQDFDPRGPPQDFDHRGPPQDFDPHGPGRSRPRGPPREYDPLEPRGNYDRRGPRQDFDHHGPPQDFNHRGHPEDFDQRRPPHDFDYRGPLRSHDRPEMPPPRDFDPYPRDRPRHHDLDHRGPRPEFQHRGPRQRPEFEEHERFGGRRDRYPRRDDRFRDEKFLDRQDRPPKGPRDGPRRHNNYEDSRWKAMQGFQQIEAREEFVIDGIAYEMKVGSRPKKMKIKGVVMEVFADPAQRGIVINKKLVYKFGEPIKRVEVDRKSYTVYFHGLRKAVWIDGTQHELRVDAPPRNIAVDGKQRGFQIDGRDMMILVDRIEKGTYGGPPRQLLIENVIHEIRFEPPPRQILIDGQSCDLILDRAVPVVIYNGKPHGIRFDGPPREMVIDDYKFVVPMDDAVKVRLKHKPHFLAFGGPAHEVVIDGKRYEIKFDNVPREIVIGHNHHTIRLEGPTPNVKILNEVPVEYENAMFKSFGMQPVVNQQPVNMPVPGPGAPGGPATVPVGPRPIMQQQPIMQQPVVGQQMGAMQGGMMMQGGPVMMQNQMMGNMQPMMGGMPMQQNQLMMGGVQQGQMFMQPGVPVSQGVGLPNVLSSLLPGAGGLQTPAAPVPTMDVGSLFQKLVAAGIIPKGENTDEKPNESKQEKEVIRGRQDMSEERPKKTFAQGKETYTKVPEFSLERTDQMKEFYRGVIQGIYEGIQCSSCGTRFRMEDTNIYREHLDWHFRQNKRGKDDTKVARNRNWYYKITDWIQFEEFGDLEEKAHSQVFEKMLQGQGPASNDTTGPALATAGASGGVSCPAATGNEQDDMCCICHDPFEQYWNEDAEDWHLRDAIRIDNKTYHPVCYEDAREEGTILEPSPTPTTSTQVNPLVEQIQQAALKMGTNTKAPLTAPEPVPVSMPVTSDVSTVVTVKSEQVSTKESGTAVTVASSQPIKQEPVEKPEGTSATGADSVKEEKS